MINTALFRPLNMLFIGVVLIMGLYFYDWIRGHVTQGGSGREAPGT